VFLTVRTLLGLLALAFALASASTKVGLPGIEPATEIALTWGNAELEFALTASAITFVAMLQQPPGVTIDAGSRTTKPGQAWPVSPA
jgi:hypothetical protein